MRESRLPDIFILVDLCATTGSVWDFYEASPSLSAEIICRVKQGKTGKHEYKHNELNLKNM